MFALSDASIEIRSGRRVVAPIRQSDRSGQATFQLPPGGYDVAVSRNGFRTAQNRINVSGRYWTHNVVLDPVEGQGGRPPENVGRQQQLVVQVTDGRTGRPLPADVRVVLGPNQFRTGRADGNGRYATTLNTGSYYVQVHQSGYQPMSQQFSVTNRQAMVRAVLQPQHTGVQPQRPTIPERRPGGILMPDGRYEIVPRSPANQQRRLNLQVIDRHTNRPMQANVRVVLGPNRFLTGKADGNGRYTVALDPGSYRVQVGYPNYKFASQNFTIGNGDANVRVALELERTVQ